MGRRALYPTPEARDEAQKRNQKEYEQTDR